MNTIKIIFIVSLFIQLSEAKSPDWYLHAPADSQEFYFSIGSGTNMQEATNDALNQISSRININIKSSFEKKVLSNQNGDYKKETFSKVSSNTEAIDFNNFTIKQQSVDENTSYVLIEVDKRKLISEKLNNFKEYDNKINQLNFSIYEDLPIDRIKNAIKLKDLIVKAKKNLILLLSISNNAEDQKQPYYNKYILMDAKIDTMISNTKINLRTNTNDLEILKSILQKELAKLGFIITQDISKNKDMIIIDINGSLSYKKEYGTFNQKMNVIFKISDLDHAYSSNNKMIEGKGAQDYKSSLRILETNTSEEIEKKGVLQFIGF